MTGQREKLPAPLGQGPQRSGEDRERAGVQFLGHGSSSHVFFCEMTGQHKHWAGLLLAELMKLGEKQPRCHSHWQPTGQGPNRVPYLLSLVLWQEFG